MIRLFLVRHGITEYNQRGVYQGQIDVPLADEGRAQVALLRDRLCAEIFTACYSAALARARETAEIILAGRGCPLHVTPDLNEMSYGQWEGLTRDQIKERFPDDWAAFIADPYNHAPLGGESHQQLQARVARTVHEIEHEFRDAANTAVLVAAHGGSVRAVVASFLHILPGDRWKLRQDNAALSIVDVFADGGELSLYNDTAHLGPSKPAPERQPSH